MATKMYAARARGQNKSKKKITMSTHATHYPPVNSQFATEHAHRNHEITVNEHGLIPWLCKCLPEALNNQALPS